MIPSDPPTSTTAEIRKEGLNKDCPSGPLSLGTTVGRYTVLAPVAGSSPAREAANAKTYIAQSVGNAGFARLAILKRDRVSIDPKRDAARLAASRKAAALNHPNVRQVLGLGFAAEERYVALEYLEGIGFDKLLRRCHQHGSDLRLSCALLAQACEGIHQAHTRVRLLHGGLSPASLFVTSGGIVKVLGLGLAARHSRNSYMAPEQVVGGRLGPRTDVFSLGVIAWEALTGRRLLPRGTRVDIGQARTPISAFVPAISPALDRAVARALSIASNKRPPSARAFGAALEAGVTAHGAALSSVAIAALVERLFSDELEVQRSTIRRARRSLLGDSEAADEAFDVSTDVYEIDATETKGRLRDPNG